MNIIDRVLDRFRHRQAASLPPPTRHYAPDPDAHGGRTQGATKAPHDRRAARARQRTADRARMVTRSRGQVIRR